MKKSTVLATPTPLSDVSFEEIYDDDYDENLKASLIDIRRKRSFRRND